MDDSGAVTEFDCDFGFPSDECLDCDGEGCDTGCENYLPDDEGGVTSKVCCSSCGRELEQVCGDGGDGEIFCIDCFLKRN